MNQIHEAHITRRQNDDSSVTRMWRILAPTPLISRCSGRRSGDQFCIYICDRFVVARLSSDERAAAAGQRFLDGRTREFIREQLSYRVGLTSSGDEAWTLETRVRAGRFATCGSPRHEPVTGR